MAIDWLQNGARAAEPRRGPTPRVAAVFALGEADDGAVPDRLVGAVQAEHGGRGPRAGLQAGLRWPRANESCTGLAQITRLGPEL
jgi:hypothetical protein